MILSTQFGELTIVILVTNLPVRRTDRSLPNENTGEHERRHTHEYHIMSSAYVTATNDFRQLRAYLNVDQRTYFPSSSFKSYRSPILPAVDWLAIFYVMYTLRQDNIWTLCRLQLLGRFATCLMCVGTSDDSIYRKYRYIVFDIDIWYRIVSLKKYSIFNLPDNLPDKASPTARFSLSRPSSISCQQTGLSLLTAWVIPDSLWRC